MSVLRDWRKWFRILHRDLGYLFFGLTVAYCVSGLALNHRRDWNPNYSVSREELSVPAPGLEKPLSKADVKDLLVKAGIQAEYQSHYVPAEGQVKIFFQNGNGLLERSSGKLVVETLHRRPLLNTFNRLHLNPGRWWTWFADVFTVSLLAIAVTGLFLLRGHHGITRRGGLLVLIGILVPTVFVLLYL
jgi:uncharacterized protein